MIINEIREQRAAFGVQTRNLSEQETTISYVDMSEIYLNPSEVGETEDKEGKQGEDREDREEPSQIFQGLQPERPPVCDCGQSDTPDLNGNPRICSDAYGEPYFDPDEGLWKRPSPPGTKKEDRG
ncbi:hypothetical protein N7488_003343 [Penicillium malachiteum]|nr:hypothetical protein N7488_003343 [Penicillium malachiteum]